MDKYFSKNQDYYNNFVINFLGDRGKKGIKGEDYELPSGKSIEYQGYEDIVYDLMLGIKKNECFINSKNKLFISILFQI